MQSKFLLATIILLSVTIQGYAQISSCAQTLRLARSTYDQGRLHELPSLLEKCLSNNGNDGFTKQEKVDAYKLLTLAFIYLEEPEKADDAMLRLLRTDPYFEINKDVDPAEFIALYNTFRTHPIYRLGVKFGATLTNPNVSHNNPLGEASSSYKQALGFYGGVTSEIPLTSNEVFTLNAEANFSIKSFKSKFNFTQNNTVYATTTGIEKENWISIPIILQYKLIPKNKFNPYIGLGFAADIMVNSSVTAEQKREGFQSIESRTFAVKPQREKFALNMVAAAGAKYRVAGGYVIGELRYMYGLTKVNSSSTLFQNQNLIWDYQYVDGIFSLKSLYVSIGYAQNFFNPKKKKVRNK